MTLLLSSPVSLSKPRPHRVFTCNLSLILPLCHFLSFSSILSLSFPYRAHTATVRLPCLVFKNVSTTHTHTHTHTNTHTHTYAQKEIECAIKKLLVSVLQFPLCKRLICMYSICRTRAPIYSLRALFLSFP